MVSFPLNPHIGSVVIPIHLLMEVIAFFFAFQYYILIKEKKQDPINESNRLAIIIGAALGALIGSRLLGALERPDLFFNPPNILFYYQSKTIVGGLLGGIIGVELTKKIIKEKKSSGDLFTFPIILGMILGRVGCFLTGVSDATVGVASTLPWAINQGDGILRHPTSLYEILFLAMLWLTLYLFQKRREQKSVKKIQKNSRAYKTKTKIKNGTIFRLFILSYLIFRFFIEFIKPVEFYIFNISAIQAACLIGIAWYSFNIYKRGIYEKNGT